jgi:hypothetical protein
MTNVRKLLRKKEKKKEKKKKRKKKERKKEKKKLFLPSISSVSEMTKDKLWVPLALGRHGTSVFYAQIA